MTDMPISAPPAASMLSHAAPVSPFLGAGDQHQTIREESSARGWWAQTLALTGRQLRVNVRDGLTLMQSLIFPVLSMIMFKVVLGDAIGKATHQNSVYGTVPLVILISAMFGSMAAAIRLNQERKTGLIGRLYVLPINRSADVSSRVLADSVRILVTTLLLLAGGLIIGFRFTQGFGGAIGLIAVAILFGGSFAMFTLAVAVNAKSGAPIVPFLGLFCSVLMFFNSGFAPVSAYPSWLGPVVSNQPMTPAIDVMRALAAGGPIASDLTKVVIWSVVILAVSIVPALRGYRRAATET